MGTPLVGDAFESLSLNRAEDLADVFSMKDRSHAGQFLAATMSSLVTLPLAIVASTGTP